MAKNCKTAGSARERKVKALLESENPDAVGAPTYVQDGGYSVTRAPASIGEADLMCIKADAPNLLVQVKANKGSPYMNFRFTERHALVLAATKAGAEAWLIHWPPHGKQVWIHSTDWPGAF